jgi:hypothetical protein
MGIDEKADNKAEEHGEGVNADLVSTGRVDVDLQWTR